MRIDQVLCELFVLYRTAKASRHFPKWRPNAKNFKVAPKLNYIRNVSKTNCDHKKKVPPQNARTLVSRPDYKGLHQIPMARVQHQPVELYE